MLLVILHPCIHLKIIGEAPFYRKRAGVWKSNSLQQNCTGLLVQLWYESVKVVSPSESLEKVPCALNDELRNVRYFFLFVIFKLVTQ